MDHKEMRRSSEVPVAKRKIRQHARTTQRHSADREIAAS
jgi:hypothetical protein